MKARLRSRGHSGPRRSSKILGQHCCAERSRFTAAPARLVAPSLAGHLLEELHRAFDECRDIGFADVRVWVVEAMLLEFLRTHFLVGIDRGGARIIVAIEVLEPIYGFLPVLTG